VKLFSLPLSREWLTTGIAIVIAFVLWRLIVAAITRFYARRFVSRFIPRLSTYSSITKSIAGAVIFIALALEILNVWHVNVLPALGAAGILGIVIGVGAQPIVRDVLTGVFYLFEDAFDVGDGVELVTTNGTIQGVVDKVSLREVRIVDDRGYVISVPYGSIVYTANATRLPLRQYIDFTVPLRDTVGSLRQDITRIAQEAVKKSGIEIEGLTVSLTDVSPAGATFRVQFGAKRKRALAAVSALRELIANDLQANGYLPKDAGADSVAVPARS
jgi:moderate conductance mechanosensitive channel